MTLAVPYDYSSIMHYGYRAFTRNGEATILPVDPSFPKENLGQRDNLSERDLLHVKTLYCSGQ